MAINSKLSILLIFCLFNLGNLRAQWTQIGADINGESVEEHFGWSVSLSSDGSRVAVGTRLNDDNGANAGQVRIYDNNSGAWIQYGNDINGEVAGDQSGWAVSLSPDGKRVAIGAPTNDDNGQDSGHTRVFRDSSGNWVQIGNTIVGEAQADRSGTSVSLSFDGNRIGIGAIANDGNGGIAGHTRIFEENNGVWVQIGNDIDGEVEADESGWSVCLSASGKRVVIGAISNDGNGNASGHARVFEEIGGNWVQVGNDMDGEAEFDALGYSVALSANGKRVAAGAINNDGGGNDSGHVRVFEENGGSWVQIGDDIDGEMAGDDFGWAVSFSFDGSRLGVGARLNDGGGNDSGHVRLFEEINGEWIQIGADLDGEDGGDRFGSSVALSYNGTNIAIGATRNDDNGDNAGHAQVYLDNGFPFMCPNNWVVSVSPSNLDTISAIQSILTIGDIVISNTDTVVFRAGGNITLNPGFQVQIGSDFQALIENCDMGAN